MIPLSTTGPYTARDGGAGTWSVLDAFGALVLIVVGDMAHHDAPLIAEALSRPEADTEALCQRIRDLESELESAESDISDLKDRIDDLEADL